MKKVIAAILFCLNVCLAGYCFAAETKAETTTPAKPETKTETKKETTAAKKSDTGTIMVADFNSGTKPNNLGGDFGGWDKDPSDKTQGCKVTFSVPGRNGKGQALKLEYDVDSTNPAYNGFWMKLDGLDVSKCKKLSFWIKGDAKDGFTKKLKIELKDESGSSPYYVQNITDSWKSIEIPFTEFPLIKDWSKMTEFVIVFEDAQSLPKAGTIYIDDIAFKK